MPIPALLPNEVRSLVLNQRMDTLDIARMLDVPESEVYNQLVRAWSYGPPKASIHPRLRAR